MKDKQEHVTAFMSQMRAEQAKRRQLDKTSYEDPPTYLTGQLVALLSPRSSDLYTNSKKFAHHYIGPLVVDSVADETHLTLRTLDGKHLPHIFHTNRIREWQEFHPRGNIRTQTDLITRLTSPASQDGPPMVDTDDDGPAPHPALVHPSSWREALPEIEEEPQTEESEDEPANGDRLRKTGTPDERRE